MIFSWQGYVVVGIVASYIGQMRYVIKSLKEEKVMVKMLKGK